MGSQEFAVCVCDAAAGTKKTGDEPVFAYAECLLFFCCRLFLFCGALVGFFARRGNLARGLGFFGKFLETINASRGINDLLLARIDRVAL